MTSTIAEDDTSTADLSAYLPLLARLRNGTRPQPDWSAIVDDAVQVWARPGFDTFLATPRLRFVPFDHQLRAARTVLQRMRGRGILADEVGLGKTIEAGLVLSELRMRGLADQVLVIVPAGLVDQWRDELERKFGLPTTIAQSGSTPTREIVMDRPVTIASLAAARRDPLLGRLTDTSWDLVIVDEAHRLRNPRSASGKLARSLRARYLLMLTATPVENKLSDLYQLVSLVAPGLLGTPAQFRAKHGAASVESRPHNLEELRVRTREVMVRHRRSEVAVMLPPRLAETILVTPGIDEAGLYADIVRRVRAAATGSGRTRLALRGLTRLAGSSPAAAAPTLAKLEWATSRNGPEPSGSRTRCVCSSNSCDATSPGARRCCVHRVSADAGGARRCGRACRAAVGVVSRQPHAQGEGVGDRGVRRRNADPAVDSRRVRVATSSSAM